MTPLLGPAPCALCRKHVWYFGGRTWSERDGVNHRCPRLLEDPELGPMRRPWGGGGHRVAVTCETCGLTFSAPLSNRGRFCSKACYWESLKGKSPAGFPVADRIPRFWARVQKGDGCWEWQGTRIAHGYGRLRVGSERVLAHRYSWRITNGPIPAGMSVLHRCDNPPCVRPDHLFLGTQLDNNRDRSAKGRSYRGRKAA